MHKTGSEPTRLRFGDRGDPIVKLRKLGTVHRTVHRFWLSQRDYQVLMLRIEKIYGGTVHKAGTGPDEGTLTRGWDRVLAKTMGTGSS
jgi:Ni,Fe-hydrogenase III large subunit